jgi:hypothetical protein
MTEPTKGRGGRPGLPGWVFPLVLVLLAAAVAFHAWVGLHAEGEKVEWWGVLGDSAGPLGALFNAGALLAALWAVHLQRQDSHQAQAEFSSQLAQVTRSAEAQENLAQVQSHLANHQRTSNLVALLTLEQRHIATMADLTVKIEEMKADLANTKPFANPGPIYELEAAYRRLETALYQVRMIIHQASQQTDLEIEN